MNDDFLDDWWSRIIRDIINNSHTGAYVRGTRDYGEEEKGVIYAGREIEVLDFEDYITITMYLQGVADEDIEVEPEKGTVTILFMKDGGWKRRPIPLPLIKPETMKMSFKNFVLDIEVEKVME